MTNKRDPAPRRTSCRSNSNVGTSAQWRSSRDEQQPLRGTRRRATAAAPRHRRARAASASRCSRPRTVDGAVDGSSSGTNRANSSAAAAESPVSSASRDGAPRSAAAPPRTADKAKRSPRRPARRARHRPRHAQPGDPRRQARLADTGLAGQHHQAAPAARGLLPQRTHTLQRRRAADKWSPLYPRQHRGQRHGRPPPTRGTSNRLSAAKKYAAQCDTALRFAPPPLDCARARERDAPRRACCAECDHSSPLDIRVPRESTLDALRDADRSHERRAAAERAI